jgi:hypothetical protein
MADNEQVAAAPAAEPPPSRREARHYTVGVLLIVLGLLMLGDELRVAFAPFGLSLSVGRLWPIILIVLGLGRFLSARAEGRPGGGYWLLFLGGVFLLHTYRVLTLEQSWPLFIVMAGLSVIFGQDRQGARGR